MRSRRLKRLLVVVASIVATALSAFAADTDFPYVKGEIIVRMSAGTTAQQAALFAASQGLQLQRPMRTPGFFLFRLPDPGVPNERALTQEKIDQLRQNSSVQLAMPNYLAEKFQTPNDPMFGPQTNRQWNLFQIGLPGASGAWAVHLGMAGVDVVDIDDMYFTGHLDWLDASNNTRLLPGWNPIDGTTNVDPDFPPTGTDFTHGTMTASVIVAGTNNGLDMAGVTWEGVKLFPIAVYVLSFANIYDSYQKIIDNNNLPGAIPYYALNMSYGAFNPDAPSPGFFNQMVAQGTIPVAASGNSRPFPAGFPASFPMVVSVGATQFASGTKGVPTSYSSPGSADGTRKVDLAAPSADTSAGVVSLAYTASGTGTTGGGGTSYACPTVVGAIALLASAGMPRGDIVDALKSTAVVGPGATKPNLDTGYGEIDVAAAMTFINPRIDPITPSIDNAEFSYQTVNFEFRMFKVRASGPAPTVTVRKQDLSHSFVLNPSNYTVTVDGSDPRIVHVKGKARLSEAGSFDEGDWEIVVEGTEQAPGSSIVTGSRKIRVVYVVVPSGQSMVSVGVSIGGTSSPPGGRKPDSVYPGAQIFRWVPTGTGSYASYNPAQPNTQPAGFTPLDAEIIRATQPGATVIETPQNGPFGIGLWITSNSPSVMNFEEGPEDGVLWYRIKLRPGWNQVGNPFPYPVDWGNCLIVKIPSMEMIPIPTAATQAIVRPQLFRYELGLGGLKSYTWQSAPSGQLVPWESHWVYAFQECWLHVPPIPGIVRGRNVDHPIRGGGWMTQMRVTSGAYSDTRNFFGMTANLNETFDRIAKPPATPDGLSAWFTGNDQMRFAQDLRELSPRREEWRMTVRPNEPNADVTLSWNEVVAPPSRLRMSLRDMATGQLITMQPNGTYTFRSDENMSPREFVLTSQPDAVGRLVVSGVRIGGGSRSGGAFTIQYNLSSDANVSIRILGNSGKAIAELENRGRSAGPNSVVWNGRTTDGVSVAPGVYMVEITAETASGERARTTTPITVTR
ncbi:MAG: S8 family serine peptidase [Fimbriimonadales bacterium]|nr:S8 family serine peptidase [Fimbriimonadales bacterium]